VNQPYLCPVIVIGVTERPKNLFAQNAFIALKMSDAVSVEKFWKHGMMTSDRKLKEKEIDHRNWNVLRRWTNSVGRRFSGA